MFFSNRNSAGVYEMVISQENYLNVVMNVSNSGEPAYLTRIYIQKPVNVTYLGTEPQVCSLSLAKMFFRSKMDFIIIIIVQPSFAAI